MSGPLHNMTDCQNAHRLVLLWVPRHFSRWKRASWAICLGRLWIQWTPDFNNTLDTPNAMKAKELVDALKESNGRRIHVPKSLALDFIDDCKNEGIELVCDMEFKAGVCTITFPNNTRQ